MIELKKSNERVLFLLMNEKFYLPYDQTSPSSIEEYSKNAINKSFSTIIKQSLKVKPEDLDYLIAYYNNSYGKGSLGNLIEKYFFYYQPNNDPNADFPIAGVELKVTPYQKLKKTNAYSAGERLVISMIPNAIPLDTDIRTSHIMEKINLILLMLYQRSDNKKRTEYLITHSQLFSVTSELLEADFEIIKDDYKKIVTKIQNGEAHLLSESDTTYLSACTKGATAKKSLQPQFYNSDIKAKRRAFSFKQGFMTSIINNYIFNGVKTYESILKDSMELKDQSFEDIVINRLNKYIGYSKQQLKNKFGIQKEPNQILSILAFRMLNIKSNNAEEFLKANIVVKSIQVEQNNQIKYHMSFPTFKIEDLLKEKWDDSWLYNYFNETKFLFVVYKFDGNDYVFSGAKFWNLPIMLLEGVAKEDWFKVKRSYHDIKFYPKKNKVDNNLPKPSDMNLFFSKLHTSESAHMIDGRIYGKGIDYLERYTDILPNGDRMPIQSFWLNKNFIINQIKEFI